MRHSVPLVPIALGFPGQGLVELYILVYIIKETHRLMCLFCLISDFLSSQAVTSQVLSAFTSLTTVFEMGTGGPS